MFIASRRRAVRALVLAIAAATACANPITAPASFELPADTPVTELSRFLPDSRYAQWWREAQTCAGRTADQNEVQWLLVQGVESIQVNGVASAGVYDADRHRVYVAQFKSGHAKVIRTLSFRALLGTDRPAVPAWCADLIDTGAIE